MKTITTLSLAAMTALLIGCGGGGGGGSATPNTNNPGATSSVSSQGSSSSASATAQQAISSSNLAGKTVVSEYSNGVKVQNIKKTSYIFLPNDEVIAVFDLFDGGRKVAHGTYNESDGNNVAIITPTFDNDENFIPAFGISSPSSIDQITVGESTAIYTVTAIVDNADNGIDEATVASTAVGGSGGNTDAPMHDTFYGKSLNIYNNVSTDLVNGLQYTYDYNGNTRYDSNVALHCTDYGYVDIFVEGTTEGRTSKTYFLPDDSSKSCMEFDYSNASGNSASGSGSRNVVWYQP